MILKNVRLSTAFSYSQETIDYWKDVQGFDMSAMSETSVAYAQALAIDKKYLQSGYQTVKNFNLYTVEPEEVQKFDATFRIRSTKDHRYLREKIHGFVLAWNVQFYSKTDNPIVLNTDSYHPLTHWKQILLFIPSDENVDFVPNDVVCGKLTFDTVFHRKFTPENPPASLLIKVSYRIMKLKGEKNLKDRNFENLPKISYTDHTTKNYILTM